MMAQATASNSTALAVLTMDNHHWLIPQAEIHSLETVLDIAQEVSLENRNAPRIPEPLGYMEFRGQMWPIYCFTGDFVRVHQIPEDRRVCVLLYSDDAAFGLLCDEIEVLERDVHGLQSIPVCMAKSATVIQALLKYGEGLAYMTTTSRLANFLQAGETGRHH